MSIQCPAPDGLDIEELERMLLEAGVANPANLETVRRESGGLGTFVRSLVGLERAAATSAFSDFIEGGNFTADQLHFLSLVIYHLTVNSIMEPSLLNEPPFTELAPWAPRGIPRGRRPTPALKFGSCRGKPDSKNRRSNMPPCRDWLGARWLPKSR